MWTVIQGNQIVDEGRFSFIAFPANKYRRDDRLLPFCSTNELIYLCNNDHNIIKRETIKHFIPPNEKYIPPSIKWSYQKYHILIWSNSRSKHGFESNSEIGKHAKQHHEDTTSRL